MQEATPQHHVLRDRTAPSQAVLHTAFTDSRSPQFRLRAHDGYRRSTLQLWQAHPTSLWIHLSHGKAKRRPSIRECCLRLGIGWMDGDLRSIAHGMWHWVFYSDRTRIVLSLFVNRYRAILIFDVNTIERTL